MGYNMTKMKGYLVSVMVLYTVLVTYFLAQTAWNDEVKDTKRRGQEKLLNVLYQEERRHLRSFKDVIQTYGGLAQLKVRDKMKREDLVKAMDGVDLADRPKGGDVEHLYATDFYVEETNSLNLDPNGSMSHNVTGVLGNGGLVETGRVVGTYRPSFNPDMEPRGDLNAKDQPSILTGHAPDTGNIVIEEGGPDTFGKDYNRSSFKTHLVTNNESNSKTRQKIGVVGSSQSHRDRTGPDKTGSSGKNNSNVLTQYCDHIDAEEAHICLSERVTHFHRHHINISINHLSFKLLGDIYIYSAFLDTRRKPVSIRVMAAGPKGRNNVKRSGYWCAFSLPAVFSKQFYWNGRKEPLTAKADQATQLDYYAASVGHDRSLQFYIMSCPVPDKYFTSMVRFDSSRIHLVSGRKDSPLLETVQERIALDVVNNLGLPWQLLFNQSLNSNDNNVPRDKNNVKTADRPVDSNGSRKDVSGNMTSVSGNMTSVSGKTISSKTSGSKDGDSRYSYSSNPNSIVSCVAPISGTVGVVPMVEFLELTLLMGSQHIVMYTQHVADDVRDVLAMYQHQGLVTVLPWAIPRPASIWANGRDIALNDCLYRTMYRYEFALFHDMDEYFVSRVTPDLPSFINFLQSKGGLKNSKISDLLFSSAYFPPPSKLQSKNIMTLAGYTKDIDKFSSLRSIHRTYFNQQHVLRMLRPVMAYRVGAGERKKTVFNISPRYAGVNHYAQCHVTTSGKHDSVAPQAGLDESKNASTPRKDPKPGMVCTNTKVDIYLWRLKDKLIRQTKESIRKLNAKRKHSAT